jgi:hypothetical protein
MEINLILQNNYLEKDFSASPLFTKRPYQLDIYLDTMMVRSQTAI